MVVTFNGLSRPTAPVASARAGWSSPVPRAVPRGYIEGLEMLASMRLCANVPMQHAIQTALGGYQSINELILPGGRLRRQRDKAWELLNDIPGVSCVKPKGALYMFRASTPRCMTSATTRKWCSICCSRKNCCWCRAPASTGRHRITSGWCSCPGRGTGRGHRPSRPLPQGLQAVSKAHEKGSRGSLFVNLSFSIRAISRAAGHRPPAPPW